MSLPRNRHGERGATLIPALLMTLMLLATSASMTSSALHRYSAERTRSEEELATHMAESGLDVALYELQTVTDLAADGIGRASGTVVGGSYAATIAPAYAGAGTYTVTSVGTVAQRRRTMQMIVDCTMNVGSGVIGFTSISLNGNPNVDSYDSTVGTYASQVKGGHAGSNGNLATNGNISTSGSGQIWGSATPGPSGKYSGGFKVSGSTSPAKSNMTVPTYAYTPPGVAKTAWSGSGTLNAGTYQYKSMSLVSKDLLKISGNVTIYVDGSISSTGQAAIEVLSGAKLTIHHGSGTISIAGGGVINDNAKPSTLKIYSATTSSLSIGGNAAFFGSVNAPKASFSKVGTADYYGSIVASTVSIVGNGGVHYDTSLGGVGTPSFKVVMVRGY
jgi:hypothetical protein